VRLRHCSTPSCLPIDPFLSSGVYPVPGVWFNEPSAADGPHSRVHQPPPPLRLRRAHIRQHRRQAPRQPRRTIYFFRTEKQCFHQYGTGNGIKSVRATRSLLLTILFLHTKNLT